MGEELKDMTEDVQKENDRRNEKHRSGIEAMICGTRESEMKRRGKTVIKDVGFFFRFMKQSRHLIEDLHVDDKEMSEMEKQLFRNRIRDAELQYLVKENLV